MSDNSYMSIYSSTTDEYFESIRPAIDSEVKGMIQELLCDPEVQPILEQVFADLTPDQRNAFLGSFDNVVDFKLKVAKVVLAKLVAQTTFSITSSGKSNLDLSGQTKYLFISNHRDIILDSAFLNIECANAGMFPPRIAIGDNLLLRPWIKTLVRLCDAFIVKRKPSIREMLEESLRLSHYIRTSITNGEGSVWIAQREGRAKNSDDRTQPALLKMLTMSAEGTKDPIEALIGLNIVPMSITYEYDPCDYLKAAELLAKELNPDYKKDTMEDYVSMKTGITGQKGRVHMTFGQPLSLDQMQHIKGIESKQKKLEIIAEYIDEQIFLQYRLYPNNYIAYDLLYHVQDFTSMYSRRERLLFELYLEDQIDKAQSKTKDREGMTRKLLEMYAMPLYNHLVAKKQIRKK